MFGLMAQRAQTRLDVTIETEHSWKGWSVIYIYIYTYMYMLYIYIHVYIDIYTWMTLLKLSTAGRDDIIYIYICLYVYMYVCVYIFIYICRPRRWLRGARRRGLTTRSKWSIAGRAKYIYIYVYFYAYRYIDISI